MKLIKNDIILVGKPKRGCERGILMSERTLVRPVVICGWLGRTKYIYCSYSLTETCWNDWHHRA